MKLVAAHLVSKFSVLHCQSCFSSASYFQVCIATIRSPIFPSAPLRALAASASIFLLRHTQKLLFFAASSTAGSPASGLCFDSRLLSAIRWPRLFQLASALNSGLFCGFFSLFFLSTGPHSANCSFLSYSAFRRPVQPAPSFSRSSSVA